MDSIAAISTGEGWNALYQHLLYEQALRQMLIEQKKEADNRDAA